MTTEVLKDMFSLELMNDMVGFCSSNSEVSIFRDRRYMTAVSNMNHDMKSHS